MTLIEKILQKKTSVAIIGLGYVGLPLAIRCAEAGFKVLGIDTDKSKVDSINKGISYIPDLGDEILKSYTKSKMFQAKSTYKSLKQYDIIIICVPTPITECNDPDLSYVIAACKDISKHLRNDHVVILESTTFPGSTEETALPILNSTGLVVGTDYYLGFSPERVDPGNKHFNIKNTPKIISGITENCKNIINSFYSQIVDYTFPVSSTKSAEMAKLLENTFRNVNIALVNQLSLLCTKMGIDVWEVIEASSTKPYGFMPFYPGPGIGGHCIPIDPLYLSWKAREYEFFFSLIDTANYINTMMPAIVIERVKELLNNNRKLPATSKVLVLGASYKADIGDLRESPSIKIISGLLKCGCSVFYNDPFVPSINVNNNTLYSQGLTEEMLKSCDCVIFITPHSSYDIHWIAQNTNHIFDATNVTKQLCGEFKEKIIKL